MIERGKNSVALRFGHRKVGLGLHGDPQDFCLVGGSYTKQTLTFFYRSVELIGGLHYDQCIMLACVEGLQAPVKFIQLVAAEARCIAMKGNSGQKLHAQLTKLYMEE